MHESVESVQLGLDDVHIAHHALVVHFLHDPVVLVPASLLMNRKQHTVLFACLDHLVEFLHAHGGRFLTDHMLLRRGSLLYHLRMGRIRCRYHHNIDVRLRQHIINVGISFNAFRGIRQHIRVRVGDGHQINIVEGRHHIRIVMPHKTKTYNAKFNFFHRFRSFSETMSPFLLQYSGKEHNLPIFS